MSEKNEETTAVGKSTTDLYEQLNIQPKAEKSTDIPVEELQKKLIELEEKNDLLMRQLAEMSNLKRRTEERASREIDNAKKYGSEKFAKGTLDVADNLERSVDTLKEYQVNEQALEGVRLTLKKLQDVLADNGLVEINPVQAPFNPELHQAMSTQVDASVKDGTILTVLQKGYLLNNRLLRPALVIVAKAG